MKHIHQRFSRYSYLGVSLPLMIIILCYQTEQAQGVQTYWTGGTGDWTSSGNWSAGVPNSLSPAYINNGGTARVFVAGAAANYVGLGEGYAGGDGQGSLEIAGGELVTNFVRTGLDPYGNGAISIHSGGKLTSRFGVIGAIGDGAADVFGPNSTWLIDPNTSNDAGFSVGIFGIASLSIRQGGTVSFTYAPNPVIAGDYAESNGTITVDGTDSTFANSADLYLGKNGVGSLYVRNGGHVTNYNGDLALNGGSFGTVGVDGPGSVWTNNSVLAVGVSGTASLSVTGGGTVTSTNGRIGREVGSNGIATVDGDGSNWTASGDLSIGYFGTGTLNILSGADVSNFNANIGDGSGSDGTVTVNGQGSFWQNNSVLAVGSSGTGRLNILDYGVVINTNGRIGRSAGSAGTVVVDGGGWWVSTGVLTIGLAGTGTGTLSVTNGGLVSAAGGMSIGPNGTVMGNGAIYADVTNEGVVAPGTSPGTLTIRNGNYTQTAGGTLQIELASSTNFDKLVVGGDIAFGGTLDVSLLGGYVPRGTFSFDILDWTGDVHTGTFSAIQLPNPDGTLAWDTSQLYTTGVLSVTGSGSPDDFNGDGEVDAADFVLFRKGLGTTYTENDYNVWRANFGATAGSGSGSALGPPSQSAVPEPASAILLLLTFVIVGVNIRGRSSRRVHGLEFSSMKEHLPCVG